MPIAKTKKNSSKELKTQPVKEKKIIKQKTIALPVEIQTVPAFKQAVPILEKEATFTAQAPVNISSSPVDAAKEKKTKVLDFVIQAVLFLIFLICPIFFLGKTLQGQGFEKLMLFYFLVLIGSIAWVSRGIVKEEFRFRKTPLNWPILFVLIFFIASAIMSVNLKASFIGAYGSMGKGVAAVVVYILFYFLLVNNSSAKTVKAYFWALIFSSSLVIIYSSLQLFGVYALPLEFTRSAFFNPIGSAANLGMFLVIVLPMLAVAFTQVKEINPETNILFSILIKIYIGVAILAGLVVLSIFKVVFFWVAAIIGVAAALLFFIPKIVKITNNNLIIPITIFLLLITLAVMGNFNFTAINIPQDNVISLKDSYNIGLNGLKAKQFFGSGPSTYYYDFAKFKGTDFNSSPFWNYRFDSASNFLLELFSTTGVGGVLAVLACLLSLIYFSLKYLSRPRETGNQSVLLSVFTGFIVALVVFSKMPANNSLIIIFILIGGLLAANAAEVGGEEEKREVNIPFKISRKFSIALTVLFLAVVAGIAVLFTVGAKVVLADINARQATVSNNFESRVEKLTEAIAKAPYQDVYYLNLADQYILAVNEEAKTGKDPEKISTNLNKAVNNAKTAVSIAPLKAINNEFLALIYENASIYTNGGVAVWAKSIEDAYNKVIELDPNNPISYIKLALINVARSNAEQVPTEKEKFMNEAIKYYDIALTKKGDLSEVYYQKGIAYEKNANLNKAIEQVSQAVKTSNNNIDYVFELARLYSNRGITQAKPVDVLPEIVKEDGEENTEVKQPTEKRIERNQDINSAEQIFLSILQFNPAHANAQYSLAFLYKNLGEDDNAKKMVDLLLNTLQDEAQKDAVKKEFSGIY
jgi:tetratricopeptide (TPR) repeat protein